MDVQIPFTNDEINEHQETFVGYITIESTVDNSTIQLGRTATQLIINDNDSKSIFTVLYVKYKAILSITV